jgi:hypothetical protein
MEFFRIPRFSQKLTNVNFILNILQKIAICEMGTIFVLIFCWYEIFADFLPRFTQNYLLLQNNLAKKLYLHESLWYNMCKQDQMGAEAWKI